MLVGGIIIGWIHLMATVIWIGGVFFFDRIVGPAAQELEPPQAGKLTRALVQRFTPIAWISVIVIIITGLIRSAVIGALSPDALLNTVYGNLLLAKIVLVTIMVVIGVTTTRTGLRIAKLASSSPPPAKEIGAAQARIKTLSETNLVLGTIVIILAVALRFIGF